MLELRPAATLSPVDLAALFTAGYEDYYVPVQVDEPALGFMVRAFDLDLEASRIALRDGEPIGFCMLGLRGDEAWIGGLGVVVAERRGGLGARLMDAVLDEARGRSVREVRLEVIVENVRAIPLYERLGFEHTRVVEVWTMAGAEGSAREIAAGDAHALIRDLRRTREPWQRDDATLAHLDDLTGLEAAAGAALARVSSGRVSLLQLAGSGEALGELLAMARSLGESLSLLNLPEDDPAAAAFAELGGTVAVRQHEMALAVE